MYQILVCRPISLYTVSIPLLGYEGQRGGVTNISMHIYINAHVQKPPLNAHADASNREV